MMNEVHGILFAHRSKANLGALSALRTNSAIPFGGRYRLIDFMLSNLVNCGVTDIGIIMEARYQSLLDHLGSGKDWDLARKRGGLRLLPPFAFAKNGPQRTGFRGKMEALNGVYSYLTEIRQPYVILADGDIVVNLNLEEVYEAHRRSGADITMVCSRRYAADSSEATYVLLDDGGNITDIVDSPNTPIGAESLNIFVLSTELLLQLTNDCAAHNLYSFAQDVLIRKLGQLKIVPWIHEGYYARLTSSASYFARSMDLLDAEIGHELFNVNRPIRTKDRSDPSTYYSEDAKVSNSFVADGCIIQGTVENSILFRGVRVEPGAVVKNSILMQDSCVHQGADISYVIADKDVSISERRVLAGYLSYPMVIAKECTV